MRFLSLLTTLTPLILTLTLFPSPSLSALTSTPGSFCKCICNTNSTIIALNPSSSSPSAPPSGNSSAHHTKTCADCTRSFCFSQGLSICTDVPEDKIFTSCFQRDSVKDELVIYLFLAVTSGLLVWAGVKPWVDGWKGGLAGRSTRGGGVAAATTTGWRNDNGGGGGGGGGSGSYASVGGEGSGGGVGGRQQMGRDEDDDQGRPS